MVLFSVKDKEDELWFVLAITDGKALMTVSDGKRIRVEKIENLTDGSYKVHNRKE